MLCSRTPSIIVQSQAYHIITKLITQDNSNHRILHRINLSNNNLLSQALTNLMKPITKETT